MTSPEDFAKKLDELWRKHLPLMRSRIETIHSALEAVRDNRLTPNLRAEAAQEAHKLAGSLGTFGHAGSDAAAEIQRLLSGNVALGSVELGRIQQLLKMLSQQTES